MAKFEGSIISDLIYHEWGITEIRAVVKYELPNERSSKYPFNVLNAGKFAPPKPNEYDRLPGIEVYVVFNVPSRYENKFVPWRIYSTRCNFVNSVIVDEVYCASQIFEPSLLKSAIDEGVEFSILLVYAK
jgi:hypothetical protein